MAKKKKERWIVYQIRKIDDEHSFWSEQGVAFENKDGSLNLRLHFFPGVQLQLRKEEKEDE